MRANRRGSMRTSMLITLIATLGCAGMGALWQKSISTQHALELKYEQMKFSYQSAMKELDEAKNLDVQNREEIEQLHEQSQRLTLEKEAMAAESHRVSEALLPACLHTKAKFKQDLEKAFQGLEAEKRRVSGALGQLSECQAQGRAQVQTLQSSRDMTRHCNQTLASLARQKFEPLELGRLRTQLQGAGALLQTLLKGHTQHGKSLSVLESGHSHSAPPPMSTGNQDPAALSAVAFESERDDGCPALGSAFTSSSSSPEDQQHTEVSAKINRRHLKELHMSSEDTKDAEVVSVSPTEGSDQDAHGEGVEESGQVSEWDKAEAVADLRADIQDLTGGVLSAQGGVGVEKRNVFVNDGPRGDIDYSHMAMISKLPPKAPWRWIMAWQTAHFLEGTDDQHFRVAFSQDAVSWSSPLVMTLREQGPVWGPVLHLHGDMLWMFYSESQVCKRVREVDGAGNPRADRPVRWCPGGNIKYVKSENGLRWTKPVTIYTQAKDGNVPKVVANQMVVTREGRWLLPFWQEPPRSEPSSLCPVGGAHNAGVLLSDDHGKTWTTSETIHHSDTWLIEGSLAAMHNGTVIQMFRTMLGAIFQSRSEDGGKTWTIPTASPVLPNPNSKINLVRLAGSDVLAVAYNHAGGPGMEHVRNNLWVAVSLDLGVTWHKAAEVESVRDPFGQWHYPTMAQDKCRLLVAYSSLFRSQFAFEDPKGVGGIHLAEVDLRGVDMSNRTLLPVIRVDDLDEEDSVLSEEEEAAIEESLAHPFQDVVSTSNNNRKMKA